MQFMTTLQKAYTLEETIKNFIIDDRGIMSQARILECTREFHKTLLKRCKQKLQQA